MKHGAAGRALAALVAALACHGAAWAVPAFDAVRRDFRPSDTAVLDRSGQLLQRVRIDATVRRGQWTALADVSPALRTALVLSEDKRFYEHSGVDWRAVSAAAWGNLWNSRTRGASTLTMQLAGLLDDDLKRGGGRGVVQKIGQAVTAEQLERSWRKDQILEAYLNTVPFRGEIVGVDALSRSLFGKAPSGLDEREAAVAAALVRSPNAGTAAVTRRTCEVLRALRAADMPVGKPAFGKPADKAAGPPDSGAGDKVDCTALDMFAAGALRQRAFDPSEGIAPHAARQALRALAAPAGPQAQAGSATPGTQLPTTVRTTLSAPLQRASLAILQQQLRELAGRHVEDGALVVLDNSSGEVLAWVGSSGTLSRAAEVDGVTALRQPGSTLKPFLYAQAIAERRLTAASLVQDSSEQVATTSGLYIPQNYDHRFKGWVSVRTALAASLNVPAVRTLEMVSPDGFFEQLRNAGFPLRESGGYYGYSLALGSAEVSLLQLANAYRTLANGGRWSPVAPLVAAPAAAPAPAGRGVAAASVPPAGRQAFDARAAFIVGDILSDSNARARTFGTDSVLATRFWTAVKTGTSKDMRDNWAVGWSRRYTVAVWVGNASGAPMWDVSGVSGAAPIWAALMQQLHRHTPSMAPTPPAGLVSRPVRFGPGLEAARSEWFLAGTEQPFFGLEAPAADGAGRQAQAEGSALRIRAPAQGTIVALDPDIPPRHQRLRFEAEGRGAVWRMDGKPLGRGTRVDWLPWPGHHSVELLDAAGTVRDQLRLEVRGAGVRTATNPPAPRPAP